jgi:hypothetical protein
MLLSPLSRHVKHVLVDSGLQAEPQNRARAIPHPVCLFIIIPPSRQGWTIHPRPDRGTRRRHRSRSTPPVTMMCPVADDPRTQRNGVWCRPPLVRSRSAPGQAGATTSLRLALSRFTAGVYIAFLHADRRKNRTNYSDATRDGGVVEMRDNRTVLRPVPMLKKTAGKPAGSLRNKNFRHVL